MKSILADEIRVMRNLSDADFDIAFANEVKAEARQSMRVVYFIREASRRKHWLKCFSNLAKYCAHHGISNGDFYRKLAILNTIRDIPEVEEKIINGKLNPTTVAQVNTFCRAESKIREEHVGIDEKRELLNKIEGKAAQAVERELVRIRDGDQCTYVLTNGQKCGAKAYLEIDHIIPFAKGGEASLENLRQVCRNHNQWLAIQEFGHHKMKPYLKTF